MKGAATMVLCWHVRSLYARRKQLRPRENGCHLVESDVLCDTLGKIMLAVEENKLVSLAP